MARYLLIVTLVVVKLVSVVASESLSMQELAKTGVDAYFKEDYVTAIVNFENALVRYRMIKNIDIGCGIRCRFPNISKEIGMDFTGFDELYAFGNLLAQANCIKICKEESPFKNENLERPTEDYIRDFEKRLPYNYLQFAYWKTGQLNRAIQAAYTFLQANPDDQQMKSNLAYYAADLSHKRHEIDVEGKPYHELFPKGVELYNSKNYSGAIKTFEEAIYNYLSVLDECHALCHVEKDPQTFHGLPIAITFRYEPVLECILKCDDKMQPVVSGGFIDDFVSKTYSYLQYSYFQVQNYKMAISTAAAVLLINPKDDVAVSNMQYYMESADELSIDVKLDFVPRADAIKYHMDRKKNLAILDVIKETTDYRDEDDYEEEEPESLKDILMQEISRQVVMELGKNLRGDIG